MSPFLAVLQRDLMLALRRKTEVLTGVFFFVVVASLFPLAIGPDFKLLRLIAPGILWVGALLSSMLVLSRLFESDHRDGSLEQMCLAPGGLVALAAAKITAHWLLCGLPLVVLSPLLALQFDLSGQAMQTLALSLLVGTRTSVLPTSAALRMRVRRSAIGSVIFIESLPYQDDFLTPGSRPLRAMFLKQIRQMPNLR